MRQKFGSTFWGNYFLDAINRYYMYDARVDRGKAYANSGKVVYINIESNKVQARVRGHYGYDYKVKLEFSPYKENEKKQIIDIIENNVLILGEIINGKLPEDLMIELEKRKISIFPENWNKLNRSCDCPDWGDPCKHMAAVYFVLASQIDKNPFILFELRGLDLIKCFNIEKHLDIEYPITIKYTDEVKNYTQNEPNNIIEILKFNSFNDFILSRLESQPPFMQTDFKKLLEKFYKKSNISYPSIMLYDKIDDIDKIENILKGAKIKFFAEKNILSSHFIISHSLITNSKVKEFLKNFGDYENDYFKISPLNICRLFLNLNSSDGSKIYTYLYYLARIAYLLIESGAFFSAVLEEGDQFFCVFKPLTSPLEISKQLKLLNSITPIIAKFEKDNLFFDEMTTNKFILTSIITEYVGKIDFKIKTGLFDLFEPYIFDAIFRQVPFNTRDFKTNGFSRSIANYFSIFNLLESDIRFNLFIEKSNSDYKISIKANDEYVCNIRDRMNLIEISKLLVMFKDTIPEIDRLLYEKNVDLNPERLEEFMLVNKDLISDLGINIFLPKELKEILKPSLRVKVTSKVKQFQSFLSLDKLLEYDLKIVIGEETVTKEELENLLKLGRKLVSFKDKFVLLNPKDINKLLEECTKKKSLSKYDLLQSKFNNSIEIDEKLNRYLDDLFSYKEFPLPVINTTLRQYQLRGFNWALNNLLNGFGIVLADDMGLGKTIQSIAIVKYLKETNFLDGNVLVITPTTLLNNWENEILKFAPDLSYSFYYGQKRKFNKTDIIFTSYHTLRIDIELLKRYNFGCIVIDEAQNIKNPENLTTKAVKSIKAKYRIALSGTPVENNLSELWSIFDFALPNYLKTLKDFQNTYAKPIEISRDDEKITKLKNITAPFMLRRLKTDKSIIDDLPEKNVIDQLITMEKQQAALYQAVVDKTLEELKDSDKKSRSSHILKLLVSLKQICNHPRNYDKQSPISKELSGKTKTLIDLLDIILSNNEKALIFTQYVEMGNILKSIISDELLIEPLFLEGSQNKQKRQELIERFEDQDSDKIFILSLKAGGTGLNLTQANNVIHFDLWFNPAVENQATDRAFRIGQKKNVNVYRFVTKNSFEEKIDKMIKSKQELTNLTVSTQEIWLGNLSNDELKYIFSTELNKVVN